jgi:hypothetical protein
MLQPRPDSGSCVISPANYGNNPQTFDEKKLLGEYMDYKMPDWFGATLPPNIVHKDIWDLVGGYSIEFSPGMYSDPDFSAKLWMAGIRLFKGLSKSRVYHFEAHSTRRIKKNQGHIQFLDKWKLTSSSFRKDLMKRGEAFDISTLEGIHSHSLRKNIIRSRIKSLLYLFKSRSAYSLWDEKNNVIQ